jgi:hypothetical protein
MRDLSLAEDGIVVGAGANDIEIHNINLPPKIGIATNPIEPDAGAGLPVMPPPHTGPVLPPAATQ